MSTYEVERSLVSSPEAVHIAGKTSAELSFRIIPKMLKEISSLYPYNKRHSYSTYTYNIAAMIWTAGRVQGIREERARRRKAGVPHAG